jgi:23S rRNA (cytidine1920-2'-O)/16S rRNA (cytidine1409-2'-O)-methyltransferase
MKKVRLDLLVVEKGQVESRSIAQRLIMEGRVRIDGVIVSKPGMTVSDSSSIEIHQSPQFVSRGGEKLNAAILGMNIPVSGFICADVGASTGGFTDCLLQHGAIKVYAIDVGYGQLDWRLRNDPRVVVMERTNARHIQVLKEPVDLVTIDASFISLKILVSVVKDWIKPSGSIVALIKPQFEAGRQEVNRGSGVISDPAIRSRIVEDIRNFLHTSGFLIKGIIQSPITGPKGNVEFLIWGVKTD